MQVVSSRHTVSMMNYESTEPSMKELLTNSIDDVDLIFRQLSEILVVPKNQRAQSEDNRVTNLIRLLQIKEAALKRNLQSLEEHGERQKLLNRLEAEVKKRDEDVVKLQNCLRDAESRLTTAIFQANQKRKSIATSNHRKVSVEELIRFAHRISSSNSVAAPDNWQQGDPQRPYPTDAEMRCGILSRISVGNYGGFVDPMVGLDPVLPGNQFSQEPMLSGHRPPGIHQPPQQAHNYASQNAAMGQFGHSVGPNQAGVGGYASPMMPFGSPGSHHGGSAPPTPTQQFSAGGGNLPPSMMWGSPRGNMSGAVTTPPQFHQVGGSGLNPQTSPRVRQQMAGPPLPTGPHFGGFGHPQPPAQAGNFMSPPMMGTHQTSPHLSRPPFGHPQAAAKNIRPSTPISNSANIGSQPKQLESVKTEVEILSSDSSSSSSSDET